MTSQLIAPENAVP